MVGIVVGNSTPSAATYSIDGGTPFLSTLPLSPQRIPNQAFFQSQKLSAAMHTLSINVTEAAPGSPYVLDYFAVIPATAQEMAAQSATLKAAPNNSKVDKIVGATLGVVAFLVIAAFLFLLYRRRQQRQRLLLRQNYPSYLRQTYPGQPGTFSFHISCYDKSSDGTTEFVKIPPCSPARRPSCPMLGNRLHHGLRRHSPLPLTRSSSTWPIRPLLRGQTHQHSRRTGRRSSPTLRRPRIDDH